MSGPTQIIVLHTMGYRRKPHKSSASHVPCRVDVVNRSSCVATCLKCETQSPPVRGTEVSSRIRAAASLRSVCPSRSTNFYQEVSATGKPVPKRYKIPTIVFVLAALAIIAFNWSFVLDTLTRFRPFFEFLHSLSTHLFTL